MRGLSRKQVFAEGELWVRVPRLPLARLENLHGSRSVKATIGSRHFAKRVQNENSPVVQRQRLLAYTQATMVRVHPGLLEIIGRVTHKKNPPAYTGGSPQSCTAIGPRRGARPSPPPCHGGDRGFESHRGRLEKSSSGTVRKRQSGEAQTFVTCGFDSHSCHSS
jgi:hypothetical protein